jgi:hypothetical protein
MNWGHVIRNTAIAIDITFVTAVGVYLAIRFLQSMLLASRPQRGGDRIEVWLNAPMASILQANGAC